MCTFIAYRGFESLSLRHVLVVNIGPFATICCEPRQVRKEATVTADSGAEVWLVLAATLFLLFFLSKIYKTHIDTLLTKITHVYIMYINKGILFMTQLNVHMTPELEKNLLKYMRVRHLKSKAEAIRTAIKEGLEHAVYQSKSTDFSSWLGLGNKIPVNKKNKFRSDDDLWK